MGENGGFLFTGSADETELRSDGFNRRQAAGAKKVLVSPVEIALVGDTENLAVSGKQSFPGRQVGISTWK